MFPAILRLLSPAQSPRIYRLRRSFFYGLVTLVAALSIAQRSGVLPTAWVLFTYLTGAFLLLTLIDALWGARIRAFNPYPVDSLDEALAEFGEELLQRIDDGVEDPALQFREIRVPGLRSWRSAEGGDPHHG